MSDKKSKLPDLKELGCMTGKLFTDIKDSVTEIISDYKEKRQETADTEQEDKQAEAPGKAKPEAPKKTASTTKESKAKSPAEKSTETKDTSSKK